MVYITQLCLCVDVEEDHAAVLYQNISNNLNSCYREFNNPPEQSTKKWILYIKDSLHYFMQRNRVNQLVSLADTVNALAHFEHNYHTCLTLDYKTHFTSMLTPPCQFIHFTSMFFQSRSWTLVVQAVFMINITIYKAYVPYSDWCEHHTVEIHEGADVTNNTLIEQFCGHVYMESVYTKHHKAVLQINTFHAYSQFKLNIMTHYQVHEQGFAYRFHKHLVCLPTAVHTNILPSYMILVNDIATYFWYLMTSVHFNNNTETVTATEPFLYSTQIYISSFVCLASSSNVVIYRGLLSDYMRKWSVKPQMLYTCNITHTTFINTNYHMYATVTLQTSMLKSSMFLNMTFTLNGNANTGIHRLLLDGTGQQTYHSRVLMAQEFIQHGYIAATFGKLIFKNFTVKERTPTWMKHGEYSTEL